MWGSVYRFTPGGLTAVSRVPSQATLEINTRQHASRSYIRITTAQALAAGSEWVLCTKCK